MSRHKLEANEKLTTLHLPTLLPHVLTPKRTAMIASPSFFVIALSIVRYLSL